MAISLNTIDNWFTHHSPSDADVVARAEIREAGRSLAVAILNNTPPSADQSAAIRKVREAVMTAIAARDCNELRD